MGNNLLNLLNTTQYTLSQILVNLLVAVVLGIAIALVYKRTHRGVSYSQSFVLSLVLITIITASVIMVIGNNLTRAFGLVGAFSVIRFRTAVKDARDIAFLFFVLTEGMAAGTGNYEIALLAFIVFTATLIILTQGKFGKYTGFDYLLTFYTRDIDKSKTTYLSTFNEFLADYLLLSFRSTTTESQVLASYNVRFKNDQQIKTFLSQLKKTGVINIELLSSQNDVDY